MFKVLKNLRKRDWLYILCALTFIVAQVWLDLKMPDYTAKLTTSISAGVATMADVWENGGLMLLCAFGSMASAFACGYCTVRVASSLAKELRFKLFNKVVSFTSQEMKTFSTPSLITRTTNDVTQVQMFIAIGLQMLIKAPILAIWAMCKISTASVEWTIATATCVGIILLTVGSMLALCLPRFKKIQTLTDGLNGVTRESVAGVRVVRAFNAEEYQEAKFEKANGNLTKTHLFTSRAMGVLMPVVSMCMNGLSLAIYWIGAYLMEKAPILEKAEVIGRMTSFTQYALQVVMAFMMIVMVFIFLPRAIISAKRVNEVLDTEVCIQSGNIKESDSNKIGELEFKNVTFKYFDGSSDCLTDVSFKVNKGETVAIVGSTGSGKTTILDLIPRYYDVTGGEVLIDGINVKDYDKETLNQKISIVSQKAVLFKGDIKSNIVYGREGVLDDDPRIEQALTIAKADFVKDLDEGIKSPVAQGGTNFSGGQKQRLSIARAIFKDSEIIIFDDSFSALDYKTDMQVRQNIKLSLSDKTIIIVAQRIGTIKNADKILVLEDGKIVGQGKHEQLMQECSVYKEIALSQLSKEEL